MNWSSRILFSFAYINHIGNNYNMAVYFNQFAFIPYFNIPAYKFCFLTGLYKFIFIHGFLSPGHNLWRVGLAWPKDKKKKQRTKYILFL